MNKQTLYRIAVSVLFLFFGSLPASAQSQGYVMTVQVPFDFQVNERLLPAGKYLIKRASQTPNFLLIQCPEQKIWVTVHTILHRLSEYPTRTSLTFKKYDEKHFLSELKVEGRGDGYALFKSKTERRLAQIEKGKTIHATQARPNSDAANN